MIDMKDIYQLYGYGKKYALHTCSGKSGKQPKLVLIYPYTDRFKAFLDPFSYEKTTGLNSSWFHLTYPTYPHMEVRYSQSQKPPKKCKILFFRI